jgi:hypothetical protein
MSELIDSLIKIDNPFDPNEKLIKLPSKAKEIIPGCLWVVERITDCWCEFIFLTFSFEDDSVIGTEKLFSASGPLASLKECRHTYWGDDGYIFYPNMDYIIASLSYLKKLGYSMD